MVPEQHVMSACLELLSSSTTPPGPYFAQKGALERARENASCFGATVRVTARWTRRRKSFRQCALAAAVLFLPAEKPHCTALLPVGFWQKLLMKYFGTCSLLREGRVQEWSQILISFRPGLVCSAKTCKINVFADQVSCVPQRRLWARTQRTRP